MANNPNSNSGLDTHDQASPRETAQEISHPISQKGRRNTRKHMTATGDIQKPNTLRQKSKDQSVDNQPV